MLSDGSVTFPKVPKPSPISNRNTPSILPSGVTVSGVRSFASQVPELCHRLGINVPHYKIEKISEGESLYRAHADFGNDPMIDGEVGEVTGIFGQKKAKERVAEEVFKFLKDIERQRKAGMSESDEEKIETQEWDEDED